MSSTGDPRWAIGLHQQRGGGRSVTNVIFKFTAGFLFRVNNVNFGKKFINSDASLGIYDSQRYSKKCVAEHSNYIGRVKRSKKPDTVGAVIRLVT